MIGLVEVKSQNGNTRQLPYGKAAHGFYVAGAYQEKMPGQLLSVMVLAGPDTESMTYTGIWVYVAHNQDLNVEISDKTNRFVTHWGDYIKSCEIKRTSMYQTPGFPASFYFQINEGGASVFESPELTNEELFVYRRK